LNSYSHNHDNSIDKNVEIVKLQEDLATITAEWRDKVGKDIYNLRTALLQTAQMERMRMARIETVSQVVGDDKPIISQMASNMKFQKQNKF